MKTLLSVITPVFQGRRFIEFCLQNVVDQGCLSQVEHIIVDGGSTDGTREVIESYARQYPHIRWISEKDRGQSHAMNKGIALAKGRFIGFLNADDYYESGALKEVLPILEKSPQLAFVAGNCRNWNTQGHLRSVNCPRKLSVPSLLLGSPFPNNPSAYFYDPFLHKKVGYYDENDHYSMDLDFILRVLPRARTFYVDSFWGNYRLIEGTKTHNAIDRGEIYETIHRHFQAHFRLLPWHQKFYVVMVKKIRTLWGRVSSWPWVRKLSSLGRYFVRRAGYYSGRLRERGRAFWRQKNNN